VCASHIDIREGTSLSYELGRALLMTEAVSIAGLSKALLVSVREGVSLARALLIARVIDPVRLEEELGRADIPVIRTVAPLPELMDRLPAGLSARMLAFPVRHDPRTRTVDVAMADPRDTHAIAEITHFLECPVRAIRAPLAALDAALAPAPSVPPIALIPRASRRPPLGPAITYETVQSTSSLPPPPPHPTTEIPIPLMRRSLHALRTSESYPPEPSTLRRIPDMTTFFVGGDTTEPDDGAVHDIEAAIARVVESRRPPALHELEAVTQAPVIMSHPGPTTLLPPDGSSMPPPPNTERQPEPASGVEPERTPVRVSVPFSQNTLVGLAPVPPVPWIDAGTIYAQMRQIATRDELLDLVVAGARTVARRVALFVLRGTEFRGWTCTPEFAVPAELRRLTIRAADDSVLAKAATGTTYLGPLAWTDVHAPLLKLMGRAGEVAATPIRVLGRVAIIIFADELGDTMIATKRFEEIAAIAGDALARIVRARR
jgi:hypothetical protein